MTCYAFSNGKYEPNFKANISINDRSVHFADAVYEVVTIYNYKLLFWDEHINRLKKSLSSLNINYKHNFRSILFKCKELIRINELEEGIIYIHISRGIAKRNHNWDKNIETSLIISCMHKQTFNPKAKKIALISRRDTRWQNCHIKTVSLLANVLLKQEAKKNSAFECLLIDANGFITEATTSNVWIVKNKILHTTPLSSNILAGVTRKKILELAKKLKIKVMEKKFKEIDVLNADGVFITNSSSLILEAHLFNNKTLKVDNKGIMATLKKKMQELIDSE